MKTHENEMQVSNLLQVTKNSLTFATGKGQFHEFINIFINF